MNEESSLRKIVFSEPFWLESFTGANAGTYELPGGLSDDDRLVKSWLNPNYVPDAVLDL